MRAKHRTDAAGEQNKNARRVAGPAGVKGELKEPAAESLGLHLEGGDQVRGLPQGLDGRRCGPSLSF